MNVLQVRYGSPTAAADFARSLRETGFAVLTDHPLPKALIEEVFAEWKRFFESPAKFDYRFKPETQEGYFPFKTENAKDSPVKDLKEFYHFYEWSREPQGIGPSTREYFERVLSLAAELLGWIQDESPLEIRDGFSIPLREMIQRSRETLLRPIHYPPLTGGEEEGAIRAAAHEDINLITLLPAATQPGLEVLDSQGAWHSISCDPGNIAINAGDMLQMASQGYYRSTTHRVVNPRGPDAKLPRYSMPLFLHPRSDVKLSPKHTARSYLDERLSEIGLKRKG